MVEIKEIVENITKELEVAEELAKYATKYKGLDRPLADMYYTLANNHLDNIGKLHEQVTRLIKEQRSKDVEIPPNMFVIWDWEHEKIVNFESRVRVLLNMYRDS